MTNSDAIPTPPAPETENSAPAPSAEVTPEAAIRRCCAAYNRQLDLACEQKQDDYETLRKAKEAYRRALPHLTSRTNIQAFLACLAHGLVLEVLYAHDAKQLAILARSTLATMPGESRPVGRPRNSPLQAENK